ncbi:WXG100 family type VII secretion target [Micromonospora sp. NPDC003197]
MAYTITIDAEALELIARELQVPAGTLRAAVQTFNNNVLTLGEPWGGSGDEIGKQWADVYVPGLENVQGGFKAIIDGLLKLSADFDQMATRYTQVEEVNAQ